MRNILILVIICWAVGGCAPSSLTSPLPDDAMVDESAALSDTRADASAIELDADDATDEVMSVLSSTDQGRDAIDRIGGKDVALTRFQQANGISNRIAEAAIKEWVLTHGWNWDWNLDEVKAICLRNRDSGIPRQYLPEGEK